MLEERIKKYPNVILAKANVDSNPAIVSDLDVTAVPSVFGFYKGEMIESFVGVPANESIDLFVDFVANFPEFQEEERREKPENEFMREK